MNLALTFRRIFRIRERKTETTSPAYRFCAECGRKLIEIAKFEGYNPENSKQVFAVYKECPYNKDENHTSVVIGHEEYFDSEIDDGEVEHEKETLVAHPFE